MIDWLGTAWILSIWVSVLTACFTCLLSVPVVISLIAGSRPFYRILASLLVSMLFVPLYVQAAAWSAGFGQQGWLPLFSLVETAKSPLYASLAVSWIHAIGLVPFAVILLRLGWSHADQSRNLAARMDGGRLHHFLHAFLPSMWPWILCIGCLAFATISSEMLITNLFQLRTLTEQYYLDSTIGELSLTGAISAIIPAIGVGLISLFMTQHWLRTPIQQSASSDRVLHSRASLSLAIALVCIVIVTMVLPIGNAILKAGADTEMQQQSVVHTWKFAKACQIVAEAIPNFAAEFQWSTLLGLLSIGIGMLVSVILLLTLPRIVIPLVISILIAAYALPAPAVYKFVTWLLPLLGSDTAYWMQSRTLIPAAIAIQFRLVPILLGSLILLRMQSETQQRLALVQDRLPLMLRSWTLIQQCWRQLGTLVLVGFAIAFADLSLSFLLLPPGVSTVASRMFELLHYGARNEESGLCMILYVVGLVCGWGAWQLSASGTRRE